MNDGNGKKITFITPGFAADESDTSCITALQLLALSLQQSGCQLTVFALHYPFTDKEYRWHGIRVVPLNGRNNFLKRRFGLRKKLNSAFEKVRAKQRIDLIHTFWLNEASLWGAELGRNYHIPVISTAMGQDVCVKNSYLSSLHKNLPDVVVTLSTFQQRELIRSAGINSIIIRHGIDPDLFVKVEKDISVIGIGNLIPLKNFSYFVRVCAELRKLEPEITIFLVGGGSEMAQLQKMADLHDLTNILTFSGALSYDETMKLLARSKVLLHPSEFEGFGMVFIEALQLQTHILASPVGFAADCDFISKLTGDSTADAACLHKLLKSAKPEKRTFSTEESASSYLEIYEKLTDKSLKTITA